MAGMKRVIDDSSHRQEVVAGNMAEYLAIVRPFAFLFVFMNALRYCNFLEYRDAVRLLETRPAITMKF